MKFFPTLMLMMAFGLSVAYSRVISDDKASLDSQQFMDRILKRQADSVLHTKKRFIEIVFPKPDIIRKALSHIHAGMTVAACKRAVRAAATSIFGSSSSIPDSLARRICETALAKLEQVVG